MTSGLAFKKFSLQACSLVSLEKWSLSLFPDIVHSEPRLGDVKRNYSDLSKAKQILGYEPLFDLETGIRRTFEYF